jgi:hypothetical protein
MKVWKARRFRGFALAELVIALAIGTLIVGGAIVLLGRTVTVADENKDKSFASLQVQFVGFWINEDVAQAQAITLGDQDYDPDGWPLTIAWMRGDGSASETITYYVVDDGEGLWKLFRQREVYVKVGDEYQYNPGQSGTHLVAEHLDPAGTSVCRLVHGEDDIAFQMKSLWVEVAADLGRTRAASTYEIYPRSIVDWFPVDLTDPDYPGVYCGTECPEPAP